MIELDLSGPLVTIVHGNVGGDVGRISAIATLPVNAGIHGEDLLFTERGAGEEVALLAVEEIGWQVGGGADGIVTVGVALSVEGGEGVLQTVIGEVAVEL